jgi:alpha-amylase
MGADLDFEHKDVRDEVIRWGKWYLDTTGADGFRLDAIKHISTWFFREWIDAMREHTGKNLFVVGEYWANNLPVLHWYINELWGKVSVFDVPLHYNFHIASRLGGYYNMQDILKGTLMQERPTNAVTLVDNHDSQPLQALESPVEDWFKPLAYAIILLRQQGYPCVFYADYYGAEYEDRGKVTVNFMISRNAPIIGKLFLGNHLKPNTYFNQKLGISQKIIYQFIPVLVGKIFFCILLVEFICCFCPPYFKWYFI